ncbi:MAG: hypothetical protein ACYTGP_10905 [Planctomycetota bacterium]|jgi:hypothetical protein
MDSLIHDLMSRGDLLPVIAVVGGLTVGAIWIVAATCHGIATARSK